MACCGRGANGAQKAEQEYLAISKTGGEKRLPDLPAVRRFLASNGGGTHQLVNKLAK